MPSARSSAGLLLLVHHRQIAFSRWWVTRGPGSADPGRGGAIAGTCAGCFGGRRKPGSLFSGWIGASFGPVVGAMIADYLLSGGNVAGPRRGINLAGYGAWLVGFVVGTSKPSVDWHTARLGYDGGVLAGDRLPGLFDPGPVRPGATGGGSFVDLRTLIKQEPARLILDVARSPSVGLRTFCYLAVCR